MLDAIEQAAGALRHESTSCGTATIFSGEVICVVPAAALHFEVVEPIVGLFIILVVDDEAFGRTWTASGAPNYQMLIRIAVRIGQRVRLPYADLHIPI